MTEQTAAWIIMGAGTVLVLVLVFLLSTLRNEEGLSKESDHPQINGGGFFSAIFHPLQKLGATIMTVVDEALKRLDAFVKAILEQVKGVKDTNDTQTAKLAELEAALAAATSDDAADTAKIAELQAEVSTLQESVAEQINAVVDTLETVTVAAPPPVETPVFPVIPGGFEVPATPIIEEVPVVEAPAVVETPVVEEVVVEAPVVEETIVEAPAAEPEA